jgi:hypothetical protein
MFDNISWVAFIGIIQHPFWRSAVCTHTARAGVGEELLLPPRHFGAAAAANSNLAKVLGDYLPTPPCAAKEYVYMPTHIRQALTLVLTLTLLTDLPAFVSLPPAPHVGPHSETEFGYRFVHTCVCIARPMMIESVMWNDGHG